MEGNDSVRQCRCCDRLALVDDGTDTEFCLTLSSAQSLIIPERCIRPEENDRGETAVTRLRCARATDRTVTFQTYLERLRQENQQRVERRE